MDGVSAAASIWALVAATGKLVGYLKGVRNAHSDQKRLGGELSILYGLLWKLAALSHTPSQPNARVSGINLVDHAAFAEYLEVLVELHNKIRPHTSSVRGAFSWRFKKEDVKDTLFKVERLKTAIHLGLGVHTLEVSDMARAGARQLYDKSERDQDQSRLDEVLKWISNTDFRAQKDSLCSRSEATAGTCFAPSVACRNWLDSHERVLFCPGIPEAGKTMLAARVMHHLESQVIISDDTMNLAYVFCDYKTVHQHSVAKTLGTILQQLVPSNKLLAEPLLILYENHVES